MPVQTEVLRTVAPLPPRAAQGARISMVSDDFLPAATGVGTHLQCLSRQLVRLGGRISVLTTRRAGQPAFEIWEGVRVHRTFTVQAYGFPQALPAPRTLERILAEEAPALVHYHYLGYLLLAVRRLAVRQGLRQLYTYHMTAEHLTQPLPLRPFRPLVAWQIRGICNGCDLVITPSRELEDRVRSNKVTAPLITISNPVVFEPCDRPERAPGAGDFAVLYAGRLAPEKNIDLLLRAFRSFRDARGCGELWLAGEGPLREGLQRQAQRLGIGAAVRFLGFLAPAELAHRYAGADVFVLPSLVETQGMTALEAMRFGRPLIVTDRIVSARELVEEGRNGFIVPAGDCAPLAQRLIQLHDDPLLRRRLGEAGRQKAKACGVESFMRQMRHIYESLLAGSPYPFPGALTPPGDRQQEAR